MKVQINPQFREIEENLNNPCLPLDLQGELRYFESTILNFVYHYIPDQRNLWFEDFVQTAKITYYTNRANHYSPAQSIARVYFHLKSLHRDLIRKHKTETDEILQDMADAMQLQESENYLPDLINLQQHLTSRQFELLILLCQGLNQKTAAKILEVTKGTVSKDLSKIKQTYQSLQH